MQSIVSTVRLALRFLLAKPLSAALNVLLLTLGLGSMCFVIVVGEQLEGAFERDVRGIDLVVGAKGSPLQLILAGVFHVDVPSGNIALADLQELAKQPLVKRVIPLSLGDSLQGFRMVGTSHDYVQHYGAVLASGSLWAQPMQAVLGAQVAAATGLQVGAQFAGAHGLGAGGEQHGTLYSVSGVLAPCACVLDRLVLTATESVWQVHEKAVALDADDQKELEAAREVTVALVQYRSPLAAITLPRWVNAHTEMQAAAPAVEITRLLAMLGVGTLLLKALGGVLLLVAGLSVWVALWHALAERQADLAMLRMLGAPPARLGGLLVAQALCLAAVGCLLGLLFGHVMAGGVGYLLAAQRSLHISGWLLLPAEWAVPALALGVALLAAAIPAWGAYRVDAAKLLHTA